MTTFSPSVYFSYVTFGSNLRCHACPAMRLGHPAELCHPFPQIMGPASCGAMCGPSTDGPWTTSSRPHPIAGLWAGCLAGRIHVVPRQTPRAPRDCGSARVLE